MLSLLSYSSSIDVENLSIVAYQGHTGAKKQEGFFQPSVAAISEQFNKVWRENPFKHTFNENNSETTIQDAFDTYFNKLIPEAFNNTVRYYSQTTSSGQDESMPRVDCAFYDNKYIKSLNENENPNPSQALFIVELKKPSVSLEENDSDWQSQIVQRGEEILNAAPWRGSVVLAVSNGINIRFVQISLFNSTLSGNKFKALYKVSDEYKLIGEDWHRILLGYIHTQRLFILEIQEQIIFQEGYQILGIGACGVCTLATLPNTSPPIGCCIKTFIDNESYRQEYRNINAINKQMTNADADIINSLPQLHYTIPNNAIITTPIGTPIDKLRNIEIKDGSSFSPIVKALQLVHENIQMVHRDIKPENIILTDNGLCLIDWGLALMNPMKEKKTYNGSILFVSENILNQMIDNNSEWFSEVDYEPVDDLISLLKVCMYCLCPGVAAKIHKDKTEYSPDSVLELWKGIWDNEDKKFKAIFEGLQIENDKYGYLINNLKNVTKMHSQL